MGLILIATGASDNRNEDAYAAICREAGATGDSVVFCGNQSSCADDESMSSDRPERTISFPISETDLEWLARIGNGGIAFFPNDGSWTPPDFRKVSTDDNSLLPWGIAAAEPSQTGRLNERPTSGWVMSADLAVVLLRSARTLEDLDLANIVDRIRALNVPVRWRSATVAFDGSQPTPSLNSEPAIKSDMSVLALVPHFQCEEWLEQCLASLVDQTRPADGIVVIDDGSHEAPLDLCRAFPEVTLLQAPESVGPYRLVQSVIGQTSFEAYLFQDADDWSACDRLELLLAHAEQSGAELIGCQQARFIHTRGRFHTMTFPLDVNWGLATGPAHGLAHPTSLVARRFLMKTGGFSAGMRFGGDTEFLHRAVLAGRVVNTPYLSYFWRGRPSSLSNSPETGHASSIRQKMLQTLYRQFNSALAGRNGEGQTPLAPMCPDSAIELAHLSGPGLRKD